PHLFLDGDDDMQCASQRLAAKPLGQQDGDRTRDAVIKRLAADTLRIGQFLHWLVVGDRIADADAERCDFIRCVESHVDVQVADSWRPPALVGTLDMSGLDTDDTPQPTYVDMTADQQCFDHAADTLETDHSVRLDR